MTRDAVLLLTHHQDHFTIDRVEKAISHRGARPIRFDTDLFPERVQLVTRIGDDGCAATLRTPSLSLELDEVHAVWLRRLFDPVLDPLVDPSMAAVCTRESHAALHGVLDSLVDARWIDPPLRVAAASNKLRQLRIARDVGLAIPRTIVGNDPTAVRALYAACGGKIVTKMLEPVSASLDGGGAFVFTNAVSEDDLDALDSLRHCPMVFQEHLPKARELRVTFVAGRFFVAAVDASASANGQVDWRKAAPDECPWMEDERPRRCCKVSALMGRLGLVYGALDFIRTPDGRDVFLEVNPSGEWGMIERALDLPIADAIAGALLGQREAESKRP